MISSLRQNKKSFRELKFLLNAIVSIWFHLLQAWQKYRALKSESQINSISEHLLNTGSPPEQQRFSDGNWLEIR